MQLLFQLRHLGSALSAAPVPERVFGAFHVYFRAFPISRYVGSVFKGVRAMVTVTPPALSVLFQVQDDGPTLLRREGAAVLQSGEAGSPGRAAGSLCVRGVVTESALARATQLPLTSTRYCRSSFTLLAVRFRFRLSLFLVLASVFPGHRKLCPFRTLQILLCTFEGPTVKRVWSHGTCTGA